MNEERKDILIRRINREEEGILKDAMKDKDFGSFISFEIDEESISLKNLYLVYLKQINVGICSMFYGHGSPEVALELFSQYRGQGLEPMITNRLVEMCFDENYKEVIFRIHKDNPNFKKEDYSAHGFNFHLVDDREELNPENKSDDYYTYKVVNPNYTADRRF